jgi:starvation-inducible DNA-binding protein
MYFQNQVFPPMTQAQLQPSIVPINPEVRSKSVLLLNQVLANLLDLQSQYKVAHWNISGIEFSYLHKLFDDLHNETIQLSDSVAELIRALGGMATGTARDVARDSKLPEFQITQYKAIPYLKMLDSSLVNCLESVLLAADELQSIDHVTNNFLLDLAGGYKLLKQVYLIESHLR